MNLITKNLNVIRDLCKTYKVKNLYVFGSVLTNRFTEKSDVDFLFSFEPEIDYNNYADNYFELLEHLQKLLNRKVDLVDEKTVINPYLKQSIEANKQVLYG